MIPIILHGYTSISRNNNSFLSVVSQLSQYTSTCSSYISGHITLLIPAESSTRNLSFCNPCFQ